VCRALMSAAGSDKAGTGPQDVPKSARLEEKKTRCRRVPKQEEGKLKRLWTLQLNGVQEAGAKAG